MYFVALPISGWLDLAPFFLLLFFYSPIICETEPHFHARAQTRCFLCGCEMVEIYRARARADAKTSHFRNIHRPDQYHIGLGSTQMPRNHPLTNSHVSSPLTSSDPLIAGQIGSVPHPHILQIQFDQWFVIL